MPASKDDGLSRLLARVGELCDRAERGTTEHTAYLTPREAKHARLLLMARGQWHRARLWGGYPDAERVCLLLFPDYVVDIIDKGAFHDTPVDELLAMAGEDSPLRAVSIRGSGYRKLSHRDYLGSLLALGLEREVLGDIAIGDEETVVFCTARILPFLLTGVERIANDVVRIKETVVPDDFDRGQKYQPIRDTIASPRLDCVVAALCNLSRGDAQGAVRAGLVEVDYDGEERVDCVVDIPCVISVRGVGKFVLRSLGAPNRRGRLPLIADKYI